MADYADFLRPVCVCRLGCLEDVCAVLFAAVPEMAIIPPPVNWAFFINWQKRRITTLRFIVAL